MEFIIVTGLSGSGKSSVVNVLEDIGFYCVDNMPPELIPTFADICERSSGKVDKVAIVTDIRGGDMFLKLNETIHKMKKDGSKIKVMFLDASDDVLIKRFKETRRKHPLDESNLGSVLRSVQEERGLLTNIKALADYYIDTSMLSANQLKSRINSMFYDNVDDFMLIRISSFGFKYGANTEADLVFDVRCLPNPFYISEIRHKTGLDSEVYDYVLSFEQAQELLKKLTDLIDFLIPMYIAEGKSQLNIAFGCTGGKHRSVTFTEALAKHLTEQKYRVLIEHRDITK